MALSPRHQAFARAVADGASFAAAARKAGYAEANARHQGAALIRNPEIQDLVHALLAETEAERSEEAAELVEHLHRLLDLAMRQVAIKDALACIREIARLRGLYPARARAPQPLPEPEATPTNPHAVEDEDNASATETAAAEADPAAATPTYPHAVSPASGMPNAARYAPAEPHEPAAPMAPDRKSPRLNSNP